MNNTLQYSKHLLITEPTEPYTKGYEEELTISLRHANMPKHKALLFQMLKPP